MPFFRRKKEEEEEYEEETPKKKLRRSEFRDLIPQNIKRRKEPPKPWGKKERLLVLIVLLLTIIIPGFLALSARSWKLPGLPRLKLPSFNLNFLKEETIVIEKDKNQAEAKKRAKTVVENFKEKTKNLSGIYGLYVVELAGGYNYGIYENEEFEPASLNKLPVMIGIFMEAEKGNLDLETKYALKSSDKRSGSGSLYGKPAGTILTYRDLVRYMGKESDNTAFNIAKNILGEEKIKEVIRDIDMKKTVVLGENQTTTPSDIGLIFKKLWEGNLVSEESRDEILEYLTNTTYESWLAAGVPEDVRVAHKFGRELHVINDAGVVFAKRPYIVVILSKGVIEREADEVFSILSKIVFQEENN